MSTLMLITNPRKKGKKKMATRKRRSSAQVAATRRLVAFNKARRGAGKAVKRRVRRASTAVAKTYRRTRTKVARTYRRARRSNAIASRGGFGIVNLLKQSGVGAVGAFAVDLVYDKLPLPAMLKTGNTAPVFKAAVTVGLGILAGIVVSKNLAHNATVGALTVQLHQIVKNLAAGAGLAGYTDINGIGYYTPAMIAEQGGDLGMYMSGVESNYSNVDEVY